MIYIDIAIHFKFESQQIVQQSAAFFTMNFGHMLPPR
jgi:hypothetical protein